MFKAYKTYITRRYSRRIEIMWTLVPSLILICFVIWSKSCPFWSQFSHLRNGKVKLDQYFSTSTLLVFWIRSFFRCFKASMSFTHWMPVAPLFPLQLEPLNISPDIAKCPVVVQNDPSWEPLNSIRSHKCWQGLNSYTNEKNIRWKKGKFQSMNPIKRGDTLHL